MIAIDYEIFSKNVKTCCAFKSINPSELAVRYGFRQKKRVYDIIEGRGKPTLEEVYTICKVLEQPIELMLESNMKIVFEVLPSSIHTKTKVIIKT